jgi:predicted Zn finger-like uncharacterized protein
LQAHCPSCQNRIVIDDAKVPDRPFSVKCPKCQTVVKFPGKGAAAAPAPAAAAESGPSAAEMAPPSEEMRAQIMAQIRRASGDPNRTGKALVGLAASAQRGAAALPLNRLGFQVDTLESVEEGGRLLDQGVYDLVVTNRGPGTLHERISRLNPEARRRLFVVVVGDEFKTGDGTQAWVVQADLALNTRDLGTSDGPILNTLGERTRLYQVFVDARRRWEQAGT